MREVINKWNGRTYKVLEETDNTVSLERDDGSQLTVEVKEFKFNYKNIDEKHKK